MNKTFLFRIIIVFFALGAAGFWALSLYQSPLGAGAWSLAGFTLSWEALRHPVFAVAGLLVCLLVLVWVFRQWRTAAASTPYQRFIGIDSAALDAKKPLCLAFYEMAFDYRCEMGSEKYRQNIISRFRFFYEFHNYALKWIDGLVSRTAPHLPPTPFIKSAVCSGHIGKVFSEISYSSGLAGMDLPVGAPLLVYSNREHIEIWSTHSTVPLCVLSKKKLLLNRAAQQGDIVRGTLNADLEHGQRAVQLEFCFPDYQFDEANKKIRRHEIYATQNYQRFKEWLEKIDTQKLADQQLNFGVTVEQGMYSDYDIPAGELIKENLLRVSSISMDQILRRLQGSRLDAFFTRRSMTIVKPTSALDALLLCSGIGLVVITEKETTGRVSYNCDQGWLVFANERSHIIENVCLHAERAKTSLAKLLRLNNLDHWPIHALVVFSADDVELVQIEGKNRLQCDVVKLNGLEQWLISCARKSSIRFSKEDHQALALLLNKKQKIPGKIDSLEGLAD